MSPCPRLGCWGWVPCTNRQGALLTGMTVGFDHRAKTSQWEFLEKVHKSLANILHLNRKLTGKQGATLCSMAFPTHTAPPNTMWGRSQPPISQFPIRSSASEGLE